jgi:Dihydrofolate reductase
MRKIVAGVFVSLDGVIEAPHEWHFPYFNDEMGAAVDTQMAASDAMLLGRVTYEEFAGYWPSVSADDEPIAAYMNDTSKYVVSTTLKTAAWKNSTVLSGDRFVEEVTKLKQQPGKNITVTGSATLIQSLLQADLLDELRLLVHPVVVGKGKRLFRDGADLKRLKLVESKTFQTGVLSLVYQPDAAPDADAA